jgi:hypothetical protein
MHKGIKAWRPRMPGGLKLVVQKTLVGGDTSCPLCGETFERFFTAAVLYDNCKPAGYVCQACFTAHPYAAAVKARKRAIGLRELADQAEKDLPASQWATIVQRTLERARKWDDLAERLERLGSWALERA